MFNWKNITVAALCSGLLGACSQPGGDTVCDGSDPYGTVSTRVILSAEEGDVRVYVFKAGNGDYFFTESFEDGWEASGDTFKRKVDLVPGDYKFLLATGFGEKILPAPAQPGDATSYDEIKLVLQQEDDTTYGSCDEVFLAEKQWTSSGPKNIEATLKRVVSRIDLNLRRGFYHEGYSAESDYEPVPYEGNENILDYIDRIEMRITGAGDTIVPGGPNEGSVTVTYKIGSEEYTTLTDEGFTEYTGPYFIPTDNEFDIDITLIPVVGKGNPQLTRRFEGLTLLENQKLSLTLWLSQLYLTIGVTAETSPIENIIEGDSGMWD